MDRQHDEIFAALAAPFAADEVKTLPKGPGLRYVTARSVMNRLDEVLGPMNWWDDYSPTAHGTICRLTIRIDGMEITKADAGGNPDMQDPGDSDKGGFSDAFKRAAVKWGIGRYLYRDGMPPYVREALGIESPRQEAPPARRESRAEAPVDQQRLGHPHAQPRKSYGPPANGRALFAWAKEAGLVDKVNDWAREQQPPFPGRMVDWSVSQVEDAYLQFNQEVPA